MDEQTIDRNARKVLRTARLPDDDDARSWTRQALTSSYVGESGERVSEEVAIQRVLKVLKTARHKAGSKEPIGATVVADVDLEGLRGKTVTLSWSMWQSGGKTRLHGNWLNSNLVYELTPTTDHDTASVDMWVPLPPAAGSYTVRVEVFLDDTRIAGSFSQAFS